MDRQQLIFGDFIKKHEDYRLNPKFLRLYNTEDNVIQRFFTYFHQEFNRLFKFMNRKNKINKHYNAQASRELSDLIEEFEEMEDLLQSEGKDILLEATYSNAIQYWKPLLAYSHGTTIPDDFRPIVLIQYKPILEITRGSIRIPYRGHIHKLQMVGEGAFSTVQKYKDDYYNAFFAVKQARKTLNVKELQRFVREFEIMKGLRFPYILEVYGFDEQSNSYTMEYCDMTLNDYIYKNSDLSFRARKAMALQFLYGINYLHRKEILHRDLSYVNILVKCYDYNAAIVKLSDFGLIKEERLQFTQSDSEIKGTIVDPCLEKFKDYNMQNEIYSIGAILLFIFTGRKNLEIKEGVIYKILAKCINSEINKRYKNVDAVMTDVHKLQG